MIKVDIKTETGVVTVHSDQDGIIRHADNKQWIDRAIIGVQSLKAGDTMQCYDLYSDVVAPKEYEVLSVAK